MIQYFYHMLYVNPDIKQRKFKILLLDNIHTYTKFEEGKKRGQKKEITGRYLTITLSTFQWKKKHKFIFC